MKRRLPFCLIVIGCFCHVMNGPPLKQITEISFQTGKRGIQPVHSSRETIRASGCNLHAVLPQEGFSAHAQECCWQNTSHMAAVKEGAWQLSFGSDCFFCSRHSVGVGIHYSNQHSNDEHQYQHNSHARKKPVPGTKHKKHWNDCQQRGENPVCLVNGLQSWLIASNINA